MKINREELRNKLDELKGAIAKNDIIQHTDAFAFLGDRIAAYNDDIALSVPTDITIQGAVPAKELMALLSKFKKDEIEVGIKGGELLFECGKTKAGLKFDPECKLPLEELGKMKGWKKIPAGLLPALKTCLFSASKDMSRPKLTCVNVAGCNVESSDSFRITRVVLEEKSAFDMLIPASNASQLVRYDMTRYCKTDGWVHFKNKEDLIFSSRVYLEEYPDLTPLFNIKGGSKIKFPKDMIESLECAEVFGKAQIDIDSEISVTIEDDLITVRGENTIGWSEVPIKAHYKGDKIEFKIHPEQFRDILTRTRRISIDDNHSKLFFTADNFSHLLGLV